MGRSVNNPLAQVLGDTQLGAEKAEVSVACFVRTILLFNKDFRSFR